MRASSAEKEKSRARILQSASRRFREHGIAGTGLADVMKDAGMTHGGFYKHFEDKDALVRAALAHAFDTVTGPVDERSDGSVSAGFADSYLSREHRDDPGRGCPIAALGGEIARTDVAARRVMTGGVEARIAQLQRGRDGSARSRAAAIRELATLVGALVIARAVEGALSDEVLETIRAGVEAR